MTDDRRIDTRKLTAAPAVVALAAALSLAATAAPTEWALYADASCLPQQSEALFEVACGGIGVFAFGPDAAMGTPSCLLADGNEEPPPYPPPFDATPFDPYAGEPGGDPPLVPGQQNWLAVVDFAGPHGDSTRWLAESTAGGGATAELRVLDTPEAMAALGSPVRDFHVLAALCAITEEVDVGVRPAPVAINMSFGRKVRSIDPVDAISCNASLASCQIARVIDHLAERGSIPIAAAGNHRQILFPAALESVTDVGMLDLDAYFAGLGSSAQPVWESSGAVRGLFPGNTLCLAEVWPAPAGSSYSSALFAGWLSFVVLDGYVPDMDPALGRWEPRFDPVSGCHLLARQEEVLPICNPAVDDLFSRLAGGPATCGTPANTPIVSAPLGPGGPPGVPSFDDWAATTIHPTPESDPCIPCWGDIGAAGLEIDVSGSAPLSPPKLLDSVYLREGGSFARVALTAGALADLGAGRVKTLLVPGKTSLDPDASLWYALKIDPLVNCSAPPPGSDACYWSSTPIRPRP